MEIKISIDDRIVDWARRLFSRPLLAAAAGVGTLVCGAGVVYGVGALTTFSSGTTISASEVNQNFDTLRTAISALENKPSGLSECTTNYGSPCGPGTSCATTCPSGQHPVGGGCDTSSGGGATPPVSESYPAGPGGAFVQSGTISDLDRWVCKIEISGQVWPFVICCAP